MKQWIAVLGAAFVAWGAHAQDTIKIGVITDRVGVSKPYSEPCTEGTIFGAEEINRRGGILGKKIELLVEDDQSRPDISAALARKLIDQGAVFILSIGYSLILYVTFGALGERPLPIDDPLAAVLPTAIYDAVLAALVGPLAIAVHDRRIEQERVDW